MKEIRKPLYYGILILILTALVVNGLLFLYTGSIGSGILLPYPTSPDISLTQRLASLTLILSKYFFLFLFFLALPLYTTYYLARRGTSLSKTITTAQALIAGLFTLDFFLTGLQSFFTGKSFGMESLLAISYLSEGFVEQFIISLTNLAYIDLIIIQEENPLTFLLAVYLLNILFIAIVTSVVGSFTYLLTKNKREVKREK